MEERREETGVFPAVSEECVAPEWEATDFEEETLRLCARVEDLLAQKAYAPLRETLDKEQPADLAALMEELSPQGGLAVFRLLQKETAAETFVEMSPEAQAALLQKFNDRELRSILDEMAMDDTVDLVEEMPANVVRRILANTDREDRAVINRLLRYPKDSAGSLMTTEYVAFRPEATVAEAFAHLKKVAIDKETVYTCYVIDKGRHLLGLVTVKDLLLANEEATIADVMEEEVIFVSTHTDDEEVVSLFDRYRFLALPVVDGENRLVGIITVDDAMEVMQENSEDDFAVMAAITPTEKPYLKTSVLSLWKSRFPWLLILMLSATFTGIIISHFESALAACVVLTAFIPMLMGTGGNSGSQSSVTVIRAISLGQLSMRNWFSVLWKELRVSVLCALVLSLATFGKILLVDGLWMGAVDLSTNGILVAFTVSVALALTVIAAKLIGGFLPLVAHKVGLDPAVMASPFITTAVDAVSLVLYFAIASAVLGV